MPKGCKSNKTRTIIACKNQAIWYQNPKEGDFFFTYTYCSLCMIHRMIALFYTCRGCPLATKDGNRGCDEFKTYKIAYKFWNLYSSGEFPKNPSKKLLEAFKARAKFYDWLAQELEKYPVLQFTKTGFKDFNLDKNL